MIEVVGLVGLALVAGGWALTIIRRSPPPPLDLTTVYFAGSVALTIYAAWERDVVFTTLNAASAVLSLINIFRAVRRAKV
ncbi:hypothetical protein TUZN_1686 [Thermoproteus uzoniensis 768-20]|uniref:CBU-0592-like domain-containing protein n=1 Tax=Thermoproteus uzoniensis (strain 768-20) TaxID=999630 RepID=F2L333_THEU7|nr:hypothetical protein [Thermoproteus uzoniensis]AEA13152.1 hypothetical protein TUZN_1686 [Thermoproteus uzoniensis 768-20]